MADFIELNLPRNKRIAVNVAHIIAYGDNADGGVAMWLSGTPIDEPMHVSEEYEEVSSLIESFNDSRVG